MTTKFDEVFGFGFGSVTKKTAHLPGPKGRIMIVAQGAPREIARFYESQSLIYNQFVHTTFRLYAADGETLLGESKELISLCITQDGNSLPPVEMAGRPGFVRGAPPPAGSEFIGDFPVKDGDVYFLEYEREEGGDQDVPVTYEALANASTYVMPEPQTEKPDDSVLVAIAGVEGIWTPIR